MARHDPSYDTNRASWNERAGIHLADQTGFYEIDAFRDMYDAADNTPFLVKETAFTDVSMAVDDAEELGAHLVYDATNGVLSVSGLDERVIGVDVFDAAGKLVATRGPSSDRVMRIKLPDVAGTCIVALRTGTKTLLKRVVTVH